MAKGRPHRLEAYLKRLYGYAFSLSHDPEMAEELVHDAVVKALGAANVPDDDPAYRAWLFRILRNAFIDSTRRPVHAEDRISRLELDADPGWQYGSETQEVNALAVRIAFAELSLAHREIIGAIDIAGLTYAEAAVLMDVPRGTVMSRISRARSALYRLVEATTTDGKLGFFPAKRQKITGGRE